MTLTDIQNEQTARQSRALDRARRVRDVADIFSTSERTIWRWIESGELKAERLSTRCVRVFDSEIARYRENLGKQAA